MPLKYDVDVVVSNFNKMPIEQFIKENFLDPETVLAPGELKDWIPNPETLGWIKDEELRGFGEVLHGKWKALAKKFSLKQLSEKSQCRKDCTTILEEMDEKTFIAPGGRFRECYYWDTYWIVKGLIVSQMYDTADTIIRNLIDIINQYGYIPNGMRIYYLGRSQPPLLSQMVLDLATIYRMSYQSLKAISL